MGEFTYKVYMYQLVPVNDGDIFWTESIPGKTVTVFFALLTFKLIHHCSQDSHIPTHYTLPYLSTHIQQ